LKSQEKKMKHTIPPRLLEELSMNAWPALQTVLLDGWVLRFANGYTRRSNSANPIYPSTGDIEEKITACEKLYREKGLNVVFKLTQDTPAEIETALAARGYQYDAATSLQTVDLNTWQEPIDEAITLSEQLEDAWLAAYCRASNVTGKNRETLTLILNAILPEHCFVSINAGGQIVALGMGVLQSGCIGLYDIVTDPAFRRQGYGRRIVKSMISWGVTRQAHTAYLQVMLNNPPALQLYKEVGFREKYQYGYRIKA
jgi:N-acetylglutamate synthase